MFYITLLPLYGTFFYIFLDILFAEYFWNKFRLFIMSYSNVVFFLWSLPCWFLLCSNIFRCKSLRFSIPNMKLFFCSLCLRNIRKINYTRLSCVLNQLLTPATFQFNSTESFSAISTGGTAPTHYFFFVVSFTIISNKIVP